MSAKDINFCPDTGDRVMNSNNTLANGVKVTLGPKGRHLTIDKSYVAPRITKGSAAVVREIESLIISRTWAPIWFVRSPRALSTRPVTAL